MWHIFQKFLRILWVSASEFNVDQFPFMKLTSVEQALWIAPYQVLENKSD